MYPEIKEQIKDINNRIEEIKESSECDANKPNVDSRISKLEERIAIIFDHVTKSTGSISGDLIVAAEEVAKSIRMKVVDESDEQKILTHLGAVLERVDALSKKTEVIIDALTNILDKDIDENYTVTDQLNYIATRITDSVGNIDYDNESTDDRYVVTLPIFSKQSDKEKEDKEYDENKKLFVNNVTHFIRYPSIVDYFCVYHPDVEEAIKTVKEAIRHKGDTFYQKTNKVEDMDELGFLLTDKTISSIETIVSNGNKFAFIPKSYKLANTDRDYYIVLLSKDAGNITIEINVGKK
jgi:hypothetical protein